MKTTQRIVKSLVASALAFALVASANTASAGTGGTEGTIAGAIWSDGSDAIISALEQTEKMICGSSCNDRVMGLLDHDDYDVRQVAAWWFAKRPGQMRMLTELSIGNLQVGDSVTVRNAADMLGTFKSRASIPTLAAAFKRSGIDVQARLAIARAFGNIGNPEANPALELAMADVSADVRLAALTAWKDVRSQNQAIAAVSLLSDSDTRVRRTAAALMGSYRMVDARVALEALLADADPQVVRNAAYALGQIGDKASYQSLLVATSHESGLVRGFARNALSMLR